MAQATTAPFNLHEYTDSFLLCRTFGHAWKEFTPRSGTDVPDLGNTGPVLNLQCTRCKSMRFDALSARGEVSRRKYIYAEGYINKSMGYIMRSEFRFELVLRRQPKGAGAVKKAASTPARKK